MIIRNKILLISFDVAIDHIRNTVYKNEQDKYTIDPG